ncbi:hypothetical protein BTA51_06905 [Hahella sp. CCB-MM4]|uniref:hypothetical protein n=1 Tax=Hahella sp. (strain CCB-MM4) TaxID=1926491 RepID=UPI000B9BF9E2|nr:hypothetical protein [Hahella sp. CCB-MM4]OZG74704.1 hypothetical protein BTA51_06905 [Hahella sp. CCB-MM4]
MRKFKRFLARSVSGLFAGPGIGGVEHLEDYLLKDIGLERVGGRVLPMEKDMVSRKLEINPLKRSKGEDPPL